MDFEKKLKEGVEQLNEENYKKSLDIAKELQDDYPDESDSYRLEAMVMQKQNQWENSEEALDKAIECDDTKSNLFNLRGFARLNQEKLDEAEEDFNKAIDIDDSAAAHRNLVLHKIMDNQTNEGINYLLERIKEEPQDIENWILMGDLMQRAGQDEKAKSYYEQAQKMDPENEYVKKQIQNLE
jgi:tetratricopeptide (TPR) repeat protein